MTTKTLKITEGAIPKLNEYIAKVNARAQRLGQAHIEAVETGREMVEHKDGSFECFVTFEVYGETPKVNGWEFIARIEHDPDLGNVLRVAPGQTLPREFWEADCNCDHCGTKRVRKDTFILREIATGEYKQIGRQCVRDFIGYDNPADMYWWVGILDTIREESEGWGGMRSNPLFSATQVIARSIAASKMYGYVSRRMVEEGCERSTTASEVSSTYYWYPNGAPAGVVAMCNMAATDEVVADAKAVIDWIVGWDKATVEKSEFNYNVSKMISKEYCRMADFGIMSCLYTIYLKAMDQIKARAVRSNLHVGSIGEKIELRVTIKTVFGMQSQFGVNHLVLMEDEAGNQFKWVASNFGDFEKEDVVMVKGTIKDHAEYKGRNQTVLTRCKMVLVKE